MLLDRETVETLCAMAEVPLERCGLILDNSHGISIVEIENVDREPERAFTMDANQLLKVYNESYDRIAGIWHTHPSGTEALSAGDIESSVPSWGYYIVTSSSVVRWDVRKIVPELVERYDRGRQS